MPHSLIVATKVFESSITLPINGLVNTGMAIDPNLNGHLTLFLCTLEQNIQRESRAGRLFMSLYKTLRPSIQDVELRPSGDYEMPKYEALPLILAALRLQQSFPIIGISDTASVRYHNDLENLALIKKSPLEI